MTNDELIELVEHYFAAVDGERFDLLQQLFVNAGVKAWLFAAVRQLRRNKSVQVNIFGLVFSRERGCSRFSGRQRWSELAINARIGGTQATSQEPVA